MSDDEVIRQRLLLDADGTGDDRKISALMKNALLWCDQDCSPSECEVGYESLVNQVVGCQFSIDKSQAMVDMNSLELDKYHLLSERIQSEIATTQEEIEKVKASLITAQQVRKNKMEYDALAKVISQEKDRKETQQELKCLQKELSSLQNMREKLEIKVEQRKKEFLGLISGIGRMKELLEREEYETIASPPTSEPDPDVQVMEQN